MELPKVVSSFLDKERNIRFDVVAYRKLEGAELVRAVRLGISMMKRKPKKNSVYKFATIIGLDGA